MPTEEIADAMTPQDGAEEIQSEAMPEIQEEAVVIDTEDVADTEDAADVTDTEDVAVTEDAEVVADTEDVADTADIEDVEDSEDAEDEEFDEEDPDFRGIIEALIFASDEPLTFKQVKELLAPNESEGSGEEEDAPVRGRRKKAKTLTITRVKRAIDWLNTTYEENGRSFRIIEVSGGFAFQTTGDYGAWVGRLFAERARRRLTQSALETLAIIAFRQPITKPSVEGIRGVNAEYVVKSLLERNLISIVGREDSPGRPLLYGTTKTFLKHFGLSSINDLPKPREIKDLLSSEDELMSNSIDELDPEKASALTRVSSQELERLFDNARLRVLEPGDASASPDEIAIEVITEDSEEVSAPVLHVNFDTDSVGSEVNSEDEDNDETDIDPVDEDRDEEADEDIDIADDDSEEEADEDSDPVDDDSEEDEELDDFDEDDINEEEMEEDLPTEDTPFDEESPDEQELI